MTTELEAAVRRLGAVAEGGLVPMPDDSDASLEGDIAIVLAALSTPPADDVREALNLDALEATARAATPGPWSAMTTGVAGGDHWYIVDDGEVVAYISANDGVDEDQREPNARHVASASPDVVLALIQRLRAAEARPRATVTGAEDVDALIAETRAFLADRPMGPPIYHRIGKLVAALEAAREARS